MSEGDTAVVPEAPAAPVAAPSESAIAVPVVETPAAAPVTDKLLEQFSATPPHSQAAPALRQGPNPVSPPVPAPAATLEVPAIEMPQPEVLHPPPAPEPAPQAPTPQPAPSAPASASITSYLSRALEKVQFRKRAKLDKILVLAAKKGSIKNDDVEKLLRVSDSTASRYLAQLVKEGRLRRSGRTTETIYEPV